VFGMVEHGMIHFANAADLSFTDVVEVGASPLEATPIPGNKVLVANSGDGTVSVVDVTSATVDKVATTVTLPGTPGQAVAAANGSEVWVAIEDLAKIVVLRQSDLGPLSEVMVGTRPHGFALSPDGGKIYLTDESAGDLVELDVATRAVSRRLSVGGAPNGVVYRAALP
jgi:YVTN family beta-propeller protein